MNKDWRQPYRDMIEKCRENDRSINAWEADFLDSIEDWFNNSESLSVKQVETLERIYNKATR